MFRQFVSIMLIITFGSVALTAQISVSGTKSLTTTVATDVTPVAGDTECGIDYVQWYLGSTAIGPRLTTAPYTYNWNTTAFVNGNYNVTARAVDKAGFNGACDRTKPNTSTSSSIAVTIQNFPPDDVTPPTIIISVPQTGAVIRGPNGNFAAEAKDSSPVIQLDVMFNGRQMASLSDTTKISFRWSTREWRKQNIQVLTRATDAQGNIGEATRNFRVN